MSAAEQRNSSTIEADAHGDAEGKEADATTVGDNSTDNDII